MYLSRAGAQCRYRTANSRIYTHLIVYGTVVVVAKVSLQKGPALGRTRTMYCT